MLIIVTFGYGIRRVVDKKCLTSMFESLWQISENNVKLNFQGLDIVKGMVLFRIYVCICSMLVHVSALMSCKLGEHSGADSFTHSFRYCDWHLFIQILHHPSEVCNDALWAGK